MGRHQDKQASWVIPAAVALAGLMVGGGYALARSDPAPAAAEQVVPPTSEMSRGELTVPKPEAVPSMELQAPRVQAGARTGSPAATPSPARPAARPAPAQEAPRPAPVPDYRQGRIMEPLEPDGHERERAYARCEQASHTNDYGVVAYGSWEAAERRCQEYLGNLTD